MRRVLFVAVCCTVFLAALTVASPAKTIHVPKTLAGTVMRYSPGTLGFRFPATHVVFSWTGEEGTGVVYRLVGPAGAHGPWRQAPEWHDMEEGDTHYSGVVAVPRAVAVQVRPLGSEHLDEVDSIGVHYMNTVDGPREVRRIPTTPSANAQATTPQVISRAEWGADESLKRTSGSCTRKFWPLQQLFVHHTAGNNTNTDSAATMRAVYHFHTVSRRWCDIGYNFVIGRDGRIFEGRWARVFGPFETPNSEDRNGRVVAGAHTSGYNSGSLGVSLMGNYENATLPAAARSSLVSVLAWIADRHNLDPRARKAYRNPESGTSKQLNAIAGHRDAGNTACPGTTVQRDLPKLREDVATVVGTGRNRPSFTLVPSAAQVSYGEGATISGTLRDEFGSPLPARALTIWVRRGGGPWRVLREVMTSASGGFSFTTDMPRNSRFVAVYGGDAANWEGSSKVVRVRVRPILSLHSPGAPGSEPHSFPPGTTRVAFEGTVTPTLTGKKIRYMVFRRNANGTETLVKDRWRPVDQSGGFTGGFKPRRTGVIFRAHVRRPKGGGYGPAVRASVRFVVERG